MTHSGIMKLLRKVRSGAETQSEWERREGGVKWHYAKALFTMRLFNTQPIYSCQIFSQRPPHTVAPSQAQASNGTGGLARRHAAEENTPYPPACSSVRSGLAALQPPSALHALPFRIRTSPSSPFTEYAQLFPFLLSHWSVHRMKGEKRDLSFCHDLSLYLKNNGAGRAGERKTGDLLLKTSVLLHKSDSSVEKKQRNGLRDVFQKVCYWFCLWFFFYVIN